MYSMCVLLYTHLICLAFGFCAPALFLMMLLVVFVLLVIVFVSMATILWVESEGSRFLGRDASCPASERLKVGRPLRLHESRVGLGLGRR